MSTPVGTISAAEQFTSQIDTPTVEETTLDLKESIDQVFTGDNPYKFNQLKDLPKEIEVLIAENIVAETKLAQNYLDREKSDVIEEKQKALSAQTKADNLAHEMSDTQLQINTKSQELEAATRGKEDVIKHLQEKGPIGVVKAELSEDKQIALAVRTSSSMLGWKKEEFRVVEHKALETRQEAFATEYTNKLLEAGISTEDNQAIKDYLQQLQNRAETVLAKDESIFDGVVTEVDISNAVGSLQVTKLTKEAKRAVVAQIFAEKTVNLGMANIREDSEILGPLTEDLAKPIISFEVVLSKNEISIATQLSRQQEALLLEGQALLDVAKANIVPVDEGEDPYLAIRTKLQTDLAQIDEQAAWLEIQTAESLALNSLIASTPELEGLRQERPDTKGMSEAIATRRVKEHLAGEISTILSGFTPDRFIESVRKSTLYEGELSDLPDFVVATLTDENIASLQDAIQYASQTIAIMENKRGQFAFKDIDDDLQNLNPERQNHATLARIAAILSNNRELNTPQNKKTLTALLALNYVKGANRMGNLYPNADRAVKREKHNLVRTRISRAAKDIDLSLDTLRPEGQKDYSNIFDYRGI